MFWCDFVSQYFCSSLHLLFPQLVLRGRHLVPKAVTDALSTMAASSVSPSSSSSWSAMTSVRSVCASLPAPWDTLEWGTLKATTDAPVSSALCFWLLIGKYTSGPSESWYDSRRCRVMCHIIPVLPCTYSWGFTSLTSFLITKTSGPEEWKILDLF